MDFLAPLTMETQSVDKRVRFNLDLGSVLEALLTMATQSVDKRV